MNRNTFDVIVVGGGVIGGSIAFELARRNLRVAVFDRQEFMHEASWAAAGILSPAPDSPAAIPLVPLSRASFLLYPQFVGSIEDSSGMRTGYRTDGTLEVLFHGDAQRELSTLVTLHHGLGLACEPLRLEEAQEMEPALGGDAQAVAFLSQEGSVDTRAMGAALLAAAEASGVMMRPGTEIASIVKNGNQCSGVRTTDGQLFSAAQVVMAAGSWTSCLPEVAPYAPTRPVRGQMVALQNFGEPIHRVLRSRRGYVVPRDHARPQKLVVGSTVEHVGYEKRITAGGLERVLNIANELAPELASAEILDTWCGLRPGTPDELPIVGPTGIEGLSIATGHYRNGILLAPITAKIVADWITERRASSSWDDFSPLRFVRESSGLPGTHPGQHSGQQ